MIVAAFGETVVYTLGKASITSNRKVVALSGYNPLNWLKPIAFYSDGLWSRPESKFLMTF